MSDRIARLEKMLALYQANGLTVAAQRCAAEIAKEKGE